MAPDMTTAEAAAASPEQVLTALSSGPAGLSTEEAKRRIAELGPNAIAAQSRSLTKIVAAQARNGINVLLTGAGILTIVTGDLVDGGNMLLLMMLHIGFCIPPALLVAEGPVALTHLPQRPRPRRPVVA